MGLLARLRSLFARDDDGAPPRLPSPDDLVLLARPQGEPEATMLCELLEREGIHALARNLDAATARGGGWGPPWAYELLVLRRDLRRARELLGEEE